MLHPKLIASAGALLATLACAGTASAESISFIRGGDVWVAAPDGGRQMQITRDGGYTYQSQADDGTFIALKGRRLHRISRDGRVLADFDTPVSGERTDQTSSYFLGPFKPEISPDGRKVAYEYRYQAIENKPGCAPVGSPNCQNVRMWTGIGYSHSDRQTSWDEPGLGRQSGWTHPSWIGNDALLISDKSVLPNLDAMIDRPGDGNQTLQGWFQDDNAWYLKDGEVSRRGDAAAFVSTKPRTWEDPDIGRTDDQVTIYRLNGAPLELPEPSFSFGLAEGTYRSPTFAPDGGRIAFEDYSTSGMNKVKVADIPSQAGGCALPSAGGKTVLENARHPDWGPADVPAASKPGAPEVKPPAPNPKPDPKAPEQAVDDKVVGPTDVSTVSIEVKGAPRLRKALRSGLTVRLAGLPAGPVLGLALYRGKTVGTGTARGEGGTATIRVRFSRAARRSLARKRSVKLTVVAAGAKRAVTLRR